MHAHYPVLFHFTATACRLYKSELLEVGCLKLLAIYSWNEKLSIGASGDHLALL